MPDRLRRNGLEQETRLVIAVPEHGGETGTAAGSSADLRQRKTQHIVAMYQTDTSNWHTT
jgi:hypothetical protein